MKLRTLGITVVSYTLAIVGVPSVAGQLPFEPKRDAGASVTGAFEGWFKNSDGGFSLLLGYFNRNQKQELDVPIGAENRIEPGGPDQGQPAHFLPGRQWGLFVVKEPADFGDKKITWTIVSNGQTTVIPASLKPDYEISPLEESAGNTPPVLSFEEAGPSVQGPTGISATRKATIGSPIPLTVWVSDDLKMGKGSAIARNQKSPVVIRWTKYRGPGDVAFADLRPAVEKLERKGNAAPFSGRAVTTVSFSAPGEYQLHVVVNDLTGEGGGGFQCCWTNGLVKVTVEP